MANSLLLEKILWSSIEDYSAIWQLNWEFDIQERPSREIITASLKFLIENNLVEVYLINHLTSKFELIDVEASFTILNDENIWKEKKWDEDIYCISTTKKGEDYYSHLSSQ